VFWNAVEIIEIIAMGLCQPFLFFQNTVVSSRRGYYAPHWPLAKAVG
jgi:hypothetical protein